MDETLSTDLIFLQDLSGSFGDDLPNLQAQIPAIIATVEALDDAADFGVASFIDKPIPPFGDSVGIPELEIDGDYAYRTDLAITDDNDAVIASINGLEIGSGADLPEAQLEGLLQVALRDAELGYREGTQRVVLLSTDADFHVAGDFAGVPANDGDTVLDGDPPSTGEDYPSIEQVRDALETSGLFPVFAVTDSVVAAYEELVEALGTGAVVELSADSADFADAVSAAIGFATGIVTETGSEEADTLVGSAEDDGIFAAGGADLVDGGEGDDVVDGGAGDDSVDGGAGGDEVRGGTGDDVLEGSDGDDTLIGGIGDDTATGGPGADIFVITPAGGSDLVTDFTDGEDLLDLSGFLPEEAGRVIEEAVEGSVILTFDDGTTVTLEGAELASFDADDAILPAAALNLSGTGDADTLTGESENDVIRGFDGDDLIDGAGGNDRLVGNDGADSILGGAGDDVLIDTSADANTLDGGDGADRITTGAGADSILGGAARDVIKSGAGDDTIDAGSGNDVVLASTGDDIVLGGDGDDVIKLSNGANSVDAGAGDDVILDGDGNSTLSGGADDDVIRDGLGDDTVFGGEGEDNFFGFRGNDAMFGGTGNDILRGNLGDDTLSGGEGDDRFLLGPGLDVLAYDTLDFGDDRVVDFRVGSDRIDVSGIASVDGLEDLTITQVGGSTVIEVAGSDGEIVLGVVDDLIGNEERVFIFG